MCCSVRQPRDGGELTRLEAIYAPSRSDGFSRRAPAARFGRLGCMRRREDWTAAASGSSRAQRWRGTRFQLGAQIKRILRRRDAETTAKRGLRLSHDGGRRRLWPACGGGTAMRCVGDAALRCAGLRGDHENEKNPRRGPFHALAPRCHWPLARINQKQAWEAAEAQSRPAGGADRTVHGASD